ncbi:DNA repair protein RecO [Desulfurivibrio alkaliphilus]|uniref:DNA repair protein RecO n=1 Tax=Desulfurivibrio alkaliphilus (strain DSM 19089 / UNIQEM U267 / AHT2) TaxID=589865 RepID=D6Z383_DESAT|nr:DNA repair protein RecO [Desulfurivibrio alkaliphilus]ADH86008.1 DNA repair protein RecO [Desulfurivibrio alkaliphilus AHT 2]
MTLQHTRAVILAVRSHGEADKIVTFCGRETGKRNGIAKGAQRSRIRFVNKLELFSLLELSYEEGRSSGLVRIDQAELLEPFAAIRGDYLKYAAASLVGELLQAWLEEADPDPQLFSLLLWVLQTIAGDATKDRNPSRNIMAAVVFFELKLLDLLGYRPGLEACRQCHGTALPAGESYHFSLAGGGLICPACNRQRASRHNLLPLSLATAKILAKAQELANEKLSRLRLPPTSGREAMNFLHHYSRHLLQRDIHSRTCLQNLLNDTGRTP